MTGRSRKKGISYQTEWGWFTAGKLPVPAIQTATGTILVKEAVERERSIYHQDEQGRQTMPLREA